jgi:serine/threonine-protein kinase
VPRATASITLPDRYRVVGHLANGGMASVWEAHDELLDRPVAVKVLASHLGEDDRARRRFAREARTAAGISHPNVVTIYDVLESDGRSYIVMELLRGGTVADRLRAGEAIPHRVALRWLEQAAAALDAAHEVGVVHRDVKPANMLLDDKGRLALGDFGIARLGLEDQITQTGQVLGTAAYISPEQAMGEPATPASDRYALAVVAFELLTGAKPFTADNFAAQARSHVEDDPPRASERDIDVPTAADPVLERGMAKEPEDRWDSACAMVRALDDALAAPPPRRRGAAPDATRVMAPLPSRRSRGDETPPPGRRNGDLAGGRGPHGGGPTPGRGGASRRFGAGAVIALAALLLVVAGAVALLSGGGDDPPEQTAEREPTATRTAEATPERTKTPEPTPTATPTETATPEPTAEATPEPKPKPEKKAKKVKTGGAGNDPAALQLQAYNLNNAGDPEQALGYAQKAVDLCKGSTDVTCAYALYEYARALRMTGDPQGAIAALEERKARFPDNQPGAVEAELARARAAAGESD